MLLKMQADNLFSVLLALLLIGRVVYDVNKYTRWNNFISSVEAAEDFSKHTVEYQPLRMWSRPKKIASYLYTI